MSKQILFSIMVLLFLGGCNPTPDSIDPRTEQTETTAAPVVLVTIAPVETQPQPAAAFATPTTTPFIPLDAIVQFDAMRLRVGPGYNFETLAYFPVDSQVKVLGRAPGDNWFFVQTTDGQTGWMKTDGLKIDFNLYDVPFQSPEDTLVIKGHVYTTNGNPATDLTVMANLASDQRAEHQDVAVSDMLGQWYIYLPLDFSGEWRIEVNGWGCKSTAVNNSASCTLLGNFPPAITLQLPQPVDSWLDFQLIPR